ncbi:spore germination protein GerM [Lentibacillus populi]|uniref:Spore germination protein GerM n=1 Tax=Lentibacillus populi TaxID=1827502 RepID=A0A9W5TU93_9BACI|nr:GerMN domain-containing protein [Lentibacillus populi]GGB27998.1 spore germination protein GerM [Lentibacillus populi]
MQKRGILLVTGIMSISIILTGCFEGEQSLEDKMDPPQGAEEVDNLDNSKSGDKAANEKAKTDEEEGTAEETVKRQLFLIDANGMVAPQTLEIPKDDSMEVAAQALQYLVKDGPVQDILPNGFQAVLPAGTEVLGLDLEDNGTLVVDVSKEFENYKAENELKILQAMTYTLTQFDSVNKIKLQINGYPQDEMPVNGTPIGNGYSRTNGINLTETDTVDLIDSKAVTMYYPTEYNDTNYFVPVTQHIKADGEEVYDSIIQALVNGPGYDVNAKQVFNSDVALAAEPTLNSGVLELVFNKEILKDADKTTISDDVMETLVRTLTEQKDVKAVNVKVENVEKLFNENGKEYTEPVTREMVTNTEKL